jgi:DNA-binding response OmpR family regulator
MGSQDVTNAPDILIVDDDEDGGWMMETMLGLEGYQTRWVQTGEAALAAVKQRRPDLVLLDLGLPDLDGFEVARELRREPTETPFRIVALTGHGQPEDRRRTAEAGFDEHLVKPVDPKTIRAVIENAERA